MPICPMTQACSYLECEEFSMKTSKLISLVLWWLLSLIDSVPLKFILQTDKDLGRPQGTSSSGTEAT